MGEKLTLTELKVRYLLQYPAGNQRLAFRKTALVGATNLTFASMKMSWHRELVIPGLFGGPEVWKNNKGHMGGRGRRWWSPGARECRTLFARLFEGQSIDLEPVFSLTWAPICPGVTGPMKKWDRRLSHRRDTISVGCFCLFDWFFCWEGLFDLLCFVGKNKEMGH